MILSRTFLSVAVLSVTVLLASQQAMAGFQYAVPSAPAPAPVQNAAPQIDNGMAPMPIVPSASVEAQALPPLTGNADADQMNHAMSSQQPLYINRQPVQPAPTAPRSTQGGLVINPYPLQSEATHGNEGGPLALDQAIMEQTGQLKTIQAPGSNSAPDMIARGNITSRYDRTDSAMPARAPMPPQMDYGSSNGMTPLPGGEGPAMSPQNTVPIAPLPVVSRSPMPHPATLQYPDVAIPSLPTPVASQYTPAVGFGRDLPLALALSQVLPPDYNFSFANGVDAGSSVSWQGGKAWDEVLQDMLTPLGMRAAINGKQVVIQRG